MTKISRTELTISRSPRALAIAQKEEPWDAPDAQVSLPLRNDSGSRRAAAARRPPGFCSRSVAAASARLDPATETAASRLTRQCWSRHRRDRSLACSLEAFSKHPSFERTDRLAVRGVRACGEYEVRCGRGLETRFGVTTVIRAGSPTTTLPLRTRGS